MLKNSTSGYTESWKRERQRKLDYYKAVPFYGSQHAEVLYNMLKKVIPNIIQASVCGVVINVVTYKGDADKALHLLSGAFKKAPRQQTCQYTGLVDTTIINR